MAVEVTLNSSSEGEYDIDTYEEGTNYNVDGLGHLHVTGWDGSRLSVAAYVPGSWRKVVVKGGSA